MNNPDPFNQRPTDPDWLRACNASLAQASKDLDSAVLMIAMQEGRKTFIGFEGDVKAGGEVAELLKGMDRDPAKILAFFSMVIRVSNQVQREGKPQ